MGKKKGASTSGAAKVSRDWSASAISNRDINKLRALGFISASEDDIRLPGAVSRPKPPKGFTVMFTAFLFRGLSLPAHEFLRSLLFFYGIQLWQLTPNSILHLSIFITVCEAFLGIDPHWGLWRKIFYVKRHNDSNGPPVVGGVGFVVRKEVDYLDYPMKESVQGWRNKWFYLRDPSVSGRCSNLPPFDDKLIAKPKKSWQNTLSPEERLTADRLFDQIVTLKNTGGLTMRLRSDAILLTRKWCGEDDDEDSDGTEDAQHTLEDSDGQEEEATEDDTFIRSRRRKQPIYATVDAVAEFAEQFTRLEAENSQLRKTIRSSADQVLEANRLATDAKNENVLLKEEVKKLKQQLKDEQDARRATAAAIDKKEGVLRESIKDLLDAADITVTRRDQLREDSTADALSLAAESNVQVLGLLKKTKGALSRLYSMIFPKMKQNKTLDEMAASFLVDPSEPVEIPPSSSRAKLFPTSSSNDDSSLVRLLRDQVSSLDKDITSLRAMAALVKKKGEIATAIEQYALDGLHIATESLGFVASDAAEENKRIHEEVEAMTDVAHPKHDLWLHRPKAVVMAKFKYRVGKVHHYFDKFHAHLTMVWNTLFPLDQAPETLSALFTRFKSPERIRQLVRKELLAGAELAFASILACHPSLDLRAVANTERNLGQYYDAARGPAYTIVSRMESCLEKDLKAHWDRGARS
ncbi:hypothetical protein QYE76_021730 [Lolium multiflorum]|uniref:Transposase (putative) gypsy type domain-containing protein n=1 Tax=Lolium multiflorum TaxID=4521 RepID=A0AAD8RBD3_LOLMU|nr:hypothetical protein QYE76_021730 [Lolium multiflorum]